MDNKPKSFYNSVIKLLTVFVDLAASDDEAKTKLNNQLQEKFFTNVFSEILSDTQLDQIKKDQIKNLFDQEGEKKIEIEEALETLKKIEEILGEEYLGEKLSKEYSNFVIEIIKTIDSVLEGERKEKFKKWLAQEFS
ncbi:hypothetical protein KKH23_03610 [Patescibacteria group bacterium]|uniref:Uncharacterized protein n=1 Tax=viral metagenome TaxID=1070528 RepID=A0A6M3M7V3_9ZZZZ|nr:hypothetical protein [Patescibacteria group bacterium]MBU0776869.1 hypothetical protein [Patescibacteria group bacterium]MBU0846252.1 hypothetical protein [Patescibacteria group bacterium]MBU0922599.1 hypothetical protein [Patescibacteria group bacterium]MBU1066650.1 hypothetical protein [Patescibacteria group bacterium]